MSRKLFVLLSDLKTVRVTCRRCSGATEVLVDGVTKWAELPKCPACHTEIDAHGDVAGSLLFRFAGALLALQASARGLHIQFVVPDRIEPEAET
jgi:hypothetical protein